MSASAWPAGVARTPILVAILVLSMMNGSANDGRPAGGGDGEVRVAGVSADDLDVVSHRGVAGAVDQPDALAAAAQRVEGGQTDRTGAEDDMPGGAHGLAGLGAGRCSTAAR